jgi:hypothetical protein
MRAQVRGKAAMQAGVAVVFKIMQRLFDVHAPGVLWYLEQQPAEVEKLRALRKEKTKQVKLQSNRAC